MALRRKFSWLASGLLAAGLLAVLPSSATAAGSVPAGAVGSDISWPQCGRANPADPYSFAIIGVTGGHPFSTNDCFASEFAWAQSTGTPEMYINLDYGLRTEGPLQCSVGDTGCQAYNYGYDSAQWAYLYAAVSTNGASNALGVWWLDVEIGNYWSEDTEQNSYVVQGALDYLQRSQGKTVGAYSTSWMWAKLVGATSHPTRRTGLREQAALMTPASARPRFGPAARSG